MTKQLDKVVQKHTSEAAEITAALMLYPTIIEAAEKLGMSRTTLYERIEKYNLRQVIETKKLEAYDTLLSGANLAAENFVKKINHSSPQVSMDASREVLDRIGIVKKEKGSSVNIVGNEMSIEFIGENSNG